MDRLELALAVAEVALMEWAYPLPWWTPVMACGFIITGLVVLAYWVLAMRHG